jgi:hypothetical protein
MVSFHSVLKTINTQAAKSVKIFAVLLHAWVSFELGDTPAPELNNPKAAAAAGVSPPLRTTVQRAAVRAQNMISPPERKRELKPLIVARPATNNSLALV